MKQPVQEIDRDVKIPAAVLAAAARSEELIKAMQPPQEGEQPPVTPEGNDTPAPELDPAQLAANPVDNSQQPPADTKPQDNATDGESWEHKYKSVHGRYVRSQEEVRKLADENANLRNIIATMQAAPPPATEVPEIEPEKLITPEEASDYGEDFLKVVGKKAREEMAPVLNAYKQEIASLKQQLAGVNGFVQQDANKKLLATLDEKLPNWRDMNTNQQFLDWLGLPDPYSGAIRHDMLKAAYAQGNANRVLAFFNGFLAEEAVVAPVNAEPEIGTTTVPKIPLQNLAAPGRAKTAAATNAPAEKPIFTRAQIAAFYSDVAAGKYRGRDADKAKAEAMIFDAQREGRIR